MIRLIRRFIDKTEEVINTLDKLPVDKIADSLVVSHKPKKKVNSKDSEESLESVEELEKERRPA